MQDLGVKRQSISQVASAGISIAVQFATDDKKRGSIDQAGNLAQAETLGMTDLNDGALFNTELSIDIGAHRTGKIKCALSFAAAVLFKKRPAYAGRFKIENIN